MTRCQCKGGPSYCGQDHGIGTCKRSHGLVEVDGAELGTLTLCYECRTGRARKRKRPGPKHQTPAMVANDWGDGLFGKVKK